MTRVLLVGATAHLAPALITPLLTSPFITSLVLLSRSSIRSAAILAHPKVTQILHGDFSSFGPDLFGALRDTHRVTAVIWLVGGRCASSSSSSSSEDQLAANVGWPLRFLEGCLDHGLVRSPAGLDHEGAAAAASPAAAESEDSDKGKGKGKDKGKGRAAARYTDPETQRHPFRFLYFSVHNAVQDQFVTLWTDGRFRRLKGAGEKALLGLADEKGQGMCEVYCLRLGKVLSGGQSVANVLWMQAGGYVSDELVGRKVVSLCLGGRGDEKYGDPTGGGVLENDEVMGEGWAEFNSVTVGY